MDRRELLHKGAALACAAVIPELLSLPLSGQHSVEPTWKETTSSADALSRMKPSLEKWNPHRAVHSLTADEWDEFADVHEIYFNEHARNGDLHRIDLVIRQNETQFRKTLDHDALNYLIEHGSYQVIAQVPAGFRQGAAKLRKFYQPASFASCGGGWTTFAMYALIMGVLFPEFEPLFILLGFYYGGMGMFLCD